MAFGITVTSSPDPAQLQTLGVSSWPTWGWELSTFLWTYDEEEPFLLLEGNVTVTPDSGDPAGRNISRLVVMAAKCGGGAGA